MNLNYKSSNAISSRALSYRKASLERTVLIILVFVTVALVTLLSIRRFAYANDDNSSVYNKQYRSVTIYCGDSVESIASDTLGCGYTSLDQYINEICNINHLSRGSDLIPGNFLIIPYYEKV